MTVTATMTDFGKVERLLSAVKPAGRKHLMQVGTNAAANDVQRHLRTVSTQQQLCTTFGRAVTTEVNRIVQKGKAA